MDKDKITNNQTDELPEWLIKQYGYNIPSKLIDYLKYYFYDIHFNDIEDDYQTIIDCSSLIDLLTSCIGKTVNVNNIVIKGEINNPQEGENKNTTKSITLRSKFLLEMLKLFTNTLLNNRYSDLFKDEFGWEAKGKCSNDNMPSELMIETTFTDKELSFFKQPFSKEDIQTILNKFKNEYLPPYRGNAKQGYYYYWEYIFFKTWKIFKGEMIKEYSFIYDIAVLYGQENKLDKGFSGIIGKEKYQRIKNCINAYLKKADESEIKEETKSIKEAFRHKDDNLYGHWELGKSE